MKSNQSSIQPPKHASMTGDYFWQRRFGSSIGTKSIAFSLVLWPICTLSFLSFSPYFFLIPDRPGDFTVASVSVVCLRRPRCCLMLQHYRPALLPWFRIEMYSSSTFRALAHR
ncbi:hypothetical protein BDV37DRAFT_259322 [Aspergillus pseudonomiae]|uniref:Uncharacterized protein n=1 Tax=Aspergillus pseudonomiae TaxID=1506151 RepID=A0A5N7D0E4_9EURO|nr:uncharacterized protein BDV37DRAFT_259322 [Aspergillus pseudonomiae]KAE8399886.1 hypothetical protein BDV37DRAFT_259322 [Aspergillus pseudonomiae]